MHESELQVTTLRVVSVLRRMGLSFHLTGGIASAFHGEPRFTQDVDIVVELTAASSRELVRALLDDFVVQDTRRKGARAAGHRRIEAPHAGQVERWFLPVGACRGRRLPAGRHEPERELVPPARAAP